MTEKKGRKLIKNILSASLRRCLYEYTFLVHVYMCSQGLALVPLCFICWHKQSLKPQKLAFYNKLHVRQSSECCESCSAVLNRDSSPHVKTTAVTLYAGSCLKRGRRKSRSLIEEFVQRLVFVQEIQSKPKIFTKTDVAPKTCGCRGSVQEKYK